MTEGEDLFHHHRDLVDAVIWTKPVYDYGTVEDDRQEGYIGLWQATQLWDPSKGHSFSRFAFTCIWRQIQKGRGTRGGVDYRRAVQQRTFHSRPMSLDAVRDDDDDRTLLAGLCAPSLLDEDRSQHEARVDQVVSLLNERERVAVLEPRSRDAAERLGVTRKAVLKCRVRAYARIRNILKEEVA